MPPDVIDAPAAPAAPITPPPSKAVTEIHVTEAGVASDPGPSSAPPKPGSAKERMFSELRKKSGVEEEPVKPAATKKTAPVTGEDDTPPDTTITDEPAASADKSSTEAPAADDKGKKKASPWKLVDEHKAARLKAETELAELRKAMVDPAKVKELETKAQEYEKRAKELDEHIKYVDYTKSSEFQEKYQKPYEQAWQRWMADLGELTVQDPSGAERPIQPADLLELVNLPLQKAREAAESTFGNFADDVMSARKEIRSLFDQQQRALEEAKKLGSERTAQAQKQQQEQMEALRKEQAQVWEEANKAVVADEKYGKLFKPVEGDEEGNARLQKGYELSDRAFSVNPNNPQLTKDQRAEVVRLHAAVRNRAAAFGRVAYQALQLEAKVAELTAALAKYKSVEPGAGEPHAPTGQQVATTARDQVFGALRKIAH